MTNDQHVFEIAHDLATLMKIMKSGESIAILITRHGRLFDWSSTGGDIRCGSSETKVSNKKLVIDAASNGWISVSDIAKQTGLSKDQVRSVVCEPAYRDIFESGREGPGATMTYRTRSTAG